MTADQLENSIYFFIEELKYNPIYLGGTIIDYSTVKNSLSSMLYFPARWPKMATYIDAVMTQNLSSFASYTTSTASDENTSEFSEALYGIKCSDILAHTNDLDDLRPVLEGRQGKSRFAGDVAASLPARCAQWQMPAKEQYKGDFNVNPKNPILVIGNTYDPVTPLVSARNVSETIQNSVLLQHDAYGVSSQILAHGILELTCK